MLLQIFWQKFYRNVPGVVLYKPYEFCLNRWIWLVAMATEMLNFRKKYSEIFSEVIRGMKLKLCINVCVIMLYINCPFFLSFFFFFFFFFFYCCYACGFVAMTTLSFHRFIIGKVKVGLYFYLTLGILTKVLQYCFLGSPLRTIWIKSKLLNLISCYGKRTVNFFLHATFTAFWQNIAFIAVHSGERCGPWASGLKVFYH